MISAWLSKRGVELNLINQALGNGTKLSGARVSPSILLGLADVPGFQEWYQGLSQR
jgi:hypothetical protein